MPHICDEACHRPGGPVTTDERGTVIFRLLPDGTAELADPRKAPLAAAIFWREVLDMARLLRIPVAITEPTVVPDEDPL